MNYTNKIKHVLRNYFPSIWVFIKGNKFLFSKTSYLNQVGYIESIRQGTPCEWDGAPLPWMNYSVIDFLKRRLLKEHTLFEYGVGSSTPFWAHRVGRVVAVEHDEVWYNKVFAGLPANVQLMHRPHDDSNAYPNAILECNEQFDIVVVDGLDRVDCLKIAQTRLSSTGIIIFDDSDRLSWREGVDHLLRLGFKQMIFSGLKPTGFGADETSIFYRDRNCLGI